MASRGWKGLIIIIIIIIIIISSTLCRVFTIMYLKQAVFLVYVVLQLSCRYILQYINIISRAVRFVCSHQYFPQPVYSVQYGCFFSSWILCFPVCCSDIFWKSFLMGPVAPVITSITFVFAFHVRCISVVRSLYFRIFLASFLVTFLSPEFATSINIHVPFFIITEQYVRLIVRLGSVGFHWSVP